MQRGDLKATYSATITGNNLNPVADELRRNGYEFTQSGNTIRVKDYDAQVVTIAKGIFGLKGWWNERNVRLSPPRFVTV